MVSIETAATERARGLAALICAFLVWGVLPLYLYTIASVPPVQIMAHRVVWCLASVFAWLAVRGHLGSVREALFRPSTLKRLVLSATCLSINWFVYVWAVGNGHVVDASLGYFINPLVNVLLGVAVLRERLNRVQWLAVAIAGAGVAHITWLGGHPPFIALALAFAFGAYGVIRKTVAVDALVGLAVETLLIAPFGAAYLLFEEATGHGSFGAGSTGLRALLLFAGPLTAIPLGLFTFGARRVRYSTVGVVQYIGPTLQLLFGIFLFHESFTAARAVGFGCIWAALILYMWDGITRTRGLLAVARAE